MTPPPITLPSVPRRWQRLILIVGGLIVFLWLRLEDHGVVQALIMGLVVALLATSLWLWPRLANRPLKVGWFAMLAALTGATFGLITAASSAFLMLLKNGFHGHLNPDYPAGVMAETLARAPVWALAGALVGVAAALVALATRPRQS
ncbi:MAG: hypothetical protein U0452_12520 [Anaerolineae bacterium]